MCKRCGESVDHLLHHCPIAYELWSMVFCLFGIIHWVMPYHVRELLASWQGKFGRHRNIDLWRFVPHCLFWCLWRKRNARCFEDCERTLLDWSLVLPFYSCFSLSDLIDRCNLSLDLCHYQYTWFFSNKISYVTYQKKKSFLT